MSHLCGSTTNVSPDLLKPGSLLFLGKNRQDLLDVLRFSVLAALSKKENILYVILDHAVRLVGFAIVTAARARRLHGSIRDLVPNYWGKRVETKLANPHLNVTVKGRNPMPPLVLSPRNADITDHTANSPARSQDSGACLPYSIQFDKKPFIVLYMPHLVRMVIVLF